MLPSQLSNRINVEVMPEQWTSSLTAKSRRFKEGRKGIKKLWALDSHVGGEIGVKTVVYNAPKKKENEEREKKVEEIQQ